jgi:DNA polymerase III epsilon subunit-like protein
VKLVFFDTEVTGEHARTTLVSAGFVTLEDDSLYVTFNDYDRDQVTDWLRENVLSQIDAATSLPSPAAFARIAGFLARYSAGEPVRLVSAGLGPDLMAILELWRHAFPERRYFHALHCLPDYLNHALHMDLNTLFQVTGHDPAMDRGAFVDDAKPERRHDALHDARIVRRCFLKLLQHPEMARFRTAADHVL